MDDRLVHIDCYFYCFYVTRVELQRFRDRRRATVVSVVQVGDGRLRSRKSVANLLSHEGLVGA